jgi:6-phosphogluconolactonase
VFGTNEVLYGRGKGIYIYEMDSKTGHMFLTCTAENIPNPSYLLLSPCGNFLYCVNELKEYDGAASGSVSAFVYSKNGLSFLGSRSSCGADPCYINIDSKGTHVFVTNYADGSISAFSIEKDGSIGENEAFARHTGKSLHAARQKAPHAHSIFFDNTEKYAFVQDLGIDRTVIYKTDFGVNGKGLVIEPCGFCEFPPGSGPRHGVFHPDGRTCYVANELDVSISVLAWDACTGRLSHTCKVSIPGVDTYESGAAGADIQISLDGLRVYASVRGADILSSFIVTPEKTLLPECSVSSGGKTPRSFALSPDNAFLVAANQDTDNLVVFRTDTLEPVFETSVCTPVCIKIYGEILN